MRQLLGFTSLLKDFAGLAFAEEDVFSFVGFENCAWTVRLGEAGEGLLVVLFGDLKMLDSASV